MRYLIVLLAALPAFAQVEYVNPAAERVFRNLRDALTAAGATPNDIVSIETFFLRAEDLPAYRDARMAFFGKRTAPPATSTTVIVSGLVVPGALLEVSAVAVVPARTKKK